MGEGRLGAVVLAAAAMVAAAAFRPELAAAATPAAGCATSGPAKGGYQVTICLTAPPEGSVLVGDGPVTATVSTVGTPPALAKVQFRVGDRRVLSDYEAPYTFVLPSRKWVDGTRAITAEAQFKDGFTSARASVSVTFRNGLTAVPRNTATFTPRAGTLEPDGSLVLAAVGDGAGGYATGARVAEMMASWKPGLATYLGDVYNSGTATEMYNWYGHNGSLFSALRSITNPTPGNHEYGTTNAAGYIDYWDNIPHYYSVDTPAGWHFVSLDSNPKYNQFVPGTPQYDWLEQDLARAGPCLVVTMHHSRFSIGQGGDLTALDPMWRLFAKYGVDLVLTGHAHNYQRWQPMDGDGTPTPSGVTQIVVGIGGHDTQRFGRSDPRVVTGYDRDGQEGALRLRLSPTGARYEFIGVDGQTRDRGAVGCEGASDPTPDTTAPTAPTGLTATEDASAGAVRLAWQAAVDDVAVTSYSVLRDGVAIGTAPGTSFIDSGVTAGRSYSYTVVAHDDAGNSSAPSGAATIALAPASSTVLFSDDFESGTMAKWTKALNIGVAPGTGFGATVGARALNTGSGAHAYRSFGEEAHLFYRQRFRIVSPGSSTLYLGRLRTATGTRVLGLYRSASSGNLGLRNSVSGTQKTSTTNVSLGAWHVLAVRVDARTSPSDVEVWLDGVRISALSGPQAIGTAPLGRVEIGDDASGTWEVVFDDVTLDRRT